MNIRAARYELLLHAGILVFTTSVFARAQVEKPNEPPAQTAAPLDPKELFRRVSPSVFVVEALDEDGVVVASGGGVAVGPVFKPRNTGPLPESFAEVDRFLAATSSTLIVTNTHVIVDADAVRVKQSKQTWPANVEHLDVRSDLCLLQVKGLEATPVVLHESSTLTVGERVYALGAPKGLELSLSEGLVSGIRADPKGAVIQTSAAISRGSSGGGLFDSEGHLVGITTFFLSEGQNLNFALPTERIGALESQSAAETAKEWEMLGAKAIEAAGERAGALGPLPPVPMGVGPDVQLWMEEAKRHLAIQDEGRRSAVRAYRRALRLSPVDFRIWMKLGSVYADLRNEQNMVNAYQEALRLKPDDASVWVSFGEGYEKLRETEQAVGAYQKAVHLQPENAAVWATLANTYGPAHRKQAIQALQEAERLKPDAFVWWSIAHTYDSLRQYKQAEKAYQEAVRLEPGSAVFLSSLGSFYVFRRKCSKAREVYERLKIVDPKSFEIHRSMFRFCS